MQPILYQIGPITFYSYGFMIAVGIVAGMTYLIVEGRREARLTFDQANALFLFIFLAAFVGGKLFLFFEDPARYIANPSALVTGRGFVFYGSFLLAIPTMVWFFRHHKLPAFKMLDVMAITTCLLHMFGRVGCFLAGCCYGKPAVFFPGVRYTEPLSYASPLNVPLYPTQLMEAVYIFSVMIYLVVLKKRKKFEGQLFLTYLILYAVGRFLLEYLRGDVERGLLIDGILSHSQFLAVCIFCAVVLLYSRWSRKNPVY